MTTSHQSTPLAQIMADRGLTNNQLARMVGARTDAQVSRWRNGLRPGPKFRAKLIRKLELTEDEIKRLDWDGSEVASV